jgi:hypothetical protein
MELLFYWGHGKVNKEIDHVRLDHGKSYKERGRAVRGRAWWAAAILHLPWGELSEHALGRDPEEGVGKPKIVPSNGNCWKGNGLEVGLCLGI